MAIEVSRKLFTVHDYHRMVGAGILRECSGMELIHGEILEMTPIGLRHNAAILRATQTLVRIAENQAIVGVQGSIRLDEYNEPQPDIYLLKPRDDFYASRHVGPEDIFMIIEMGDSSLEYDETIKLSLYAETAVPEYWVVDLQTERLIAYSVPKGNTYSIRSEFRRGDTLAPQLLPECRIAVDLLLP